MRKLPLTKLKNAALIIAAISMFVLVFSSCENNPASQEKIERIEIVDNIVSAWVDEVNPSLDNGSHEEELEMGLEGNKCKAIMVRFDLPAAVLPEQIVKADLYLRYKDGSEPTIRAGLLTEDWDQIFVSWDEIADAVSYDYDIIGDSALEINRLDWFRLDVADSVKTWLGGEVSNYGLFLSELQEGHSTRFYTKYDEDVEYAKLVVEYKKTDGQDTYGRFDYGHVKQEDTNCLAYALRDLDAIDFDDDASLNSISRAYENGGNDEALQYLEDWIFAYVETHKDTLQIASIRKLERYDTKINTQTEYRVALRMGLHPNLETQQVDFFENDFDFHLIVQLSDGSWAEKQRAGPSRILPGTNLLTDPYKYSWNTSYEWGVSGNHNYYHGKVVYFAVEKTTDLFTSHMD